MSLLPSPTPPPDIGWAVAVWADDPINRAHPNNALVSIDKIHATYGEALLATPLNTTPHFVTNSQYLGGRAAWVIDASTDGISGLLDQDYGQQVTIVAVCAITSEPAGAVVHLALSGNVGLSSGPSYGRTVRILGSNNDSQPMVRLPLQEQFLYTGYTNRPTTSNVRSSINGEQFTKGQLNNALTTGTLAVGSQSSNFSASQHIGFLGLYQGDAFADPDWPDFLAWVESHYGFDPTATYDTADPPPIAWRAEYLADDFDTGSRTWPDRTGRGYTLSGGAAIKDGALRFSGGLTGTGSTAQSGSDLMIGGPTVTHLAAQNGLSAAGSATTPSFTPAPNSLLVISARCSDDVPDMAITSTTLSGVGTWTYERVFSLDNSVGSVMLAWAQLGASPGTGTVTVGWSGVHSRWAVEAATIIGHDPDNPILASASSGGPSGGGYTLDFGEDSWPMNTLLFTASAQSHNSTPVFSTGGGMIYTNAPDTNIWLAVGRENVMDTAAMAGGVVSWSQPGGSYNAAAGIAVNPHPDIGDGGFTITAKVGIDWTYVGQLQPIMSCMTDGARRLYWYKPDGQQTLALVMVDAYGQSYSFTSTAVGVTGRFNPMWYRVKYSGQLSKTTLSMYWSHDGVTWYQASYVNPTNYVPVGWLNNKDTLGIQPRLSIGRYDLANPMSLVAGSTVERLIVHNSGGSPNDADPAGDVVFDADFTALADGTTSFTESSALGATVTILGTTPQRVDNVVNGQPVVRFDGVDDYLSRTLNLSAPYTLVMIARMPTLTLGDVLFGGFNNSVYWMIGQTGATTARFGGNVGGTYLTIAPVDPTQWNLWRCYNAGAGMSAFSANETVTSTGVINLSSGLDIEVATKQPRANAYDVDVAYIGIFYGDVTTSALWPAFKTWVTSKYGITLS